MKAPFAEVLLDALEGRVRADGPVAALRDVMRVLLTVKDDLPPDEAWHYGGMVWELNSMVLRQTGINALQEGANERIRRDAERAA